MDLSNKVIVITGGGGTLGGAMAIGLAAAGASVVVTGRTLSKLEVVRDQIIAQGGQAACKVGDVLEEASMKALLEFVQGTYGRVDVLINAAGGNMAGATIRSDQTVFELSLEALDQVHQLNLNGTVIPTLVFAKAFAERGQGSVINISSMAAQQAITRIVGYSASKAATDNFTRWMAVEMALKFGEGIRVNAIAPGFFVGEQNRRLLTNEDGTYTERAQTIIAQTPMKRFGAPEELVGIAQWLSSDSASFVTGTVIAVDGGFSAFSGV